MAWVRVPPEHHPIFRAALPKDPRVETLQMFGGIAAKVNGHVFAGLFGRSAMVWLAEPDRAAALALEGASLFDPMGNGRVRSDKVMLPASVMADPAELRGWIARAFKAAATMPEKAGTVGKAPKAAKQIAPAKAPSANRGEQKSPKKKLSPGSASRPAASRARPSSGRSTGRS